MRSPRSIALATVVACGTSGPDAPAVTYGSPIACESTLSCDSTNSNARCDLTATLNDASLCPAFYSTCADDWTIVLQQTGIDTNGEYVYQHGQLVANLDDVSTFRQCLEGPPSFAPPSCDATPVKIPACP